MSRLFQLFVSLTLVMTTLSCANDSEQAIDTIKSVLASRHPIDEYKLLQLTIQDTLVKKPFINQLSAEANQWKAEHKQVNDQYFKESIDFFGADHVKHLHERKLTLEDYMDSLELIQEYLMSFINQDDFDAEYLTEYYVLFHTLENLASEPDEYLWWVIWHQYQIGKEGSGQIKEEQLYFFPRDSMIIPYDSSLDAKMVYTVYKFRSAHR